MKVWLLGACTLSCVIISTATAKADIKSITADPGWDIYTAGNYRYGPSFITYDDGSVDAWFAAPGQEYEDCTLHNDVSSVTPMTVKSSGYIAQYIKINRPFVGFSLYSPTWGKNGSESMRLSIYKWDSSITATRNGTPLATATTEKYNDNALLSVTTDNCVELPAGEYALILDNASSYAGAYIYSNANTDFSGCVYIGATKRTGAIRGHILYDSKKLMQYWDQAAYRFSEDGGKTWSDDIMSLKPTRGTRDEFSVCDPAVAYWNDYYYCGYTSTENPSGIENHLYIARSASPDGPWEKWNGEGWGGESVEPIVEYSLKGGWGIGEPSIIIKDNTVYLYYTYDSGTPSTHVATAPADDENWPARLQLQGKAIGKTSGSDHCDVKYVDAAGKFLAVNTAKRMTKDAYIQIWQSSDGIKFTPAGEGRIQGIISPSGLHNCGLSGDAIGHIDINKPQFISFAYGLNAQGLSAWGAWNTYLQPIRIQYDESSGIISVTVDETTPVQMFDINGLQVDPDTSDHGLYIRCTGANTEKIIR